MKTFKINIILILFLVNSAVSYAGRLKYEDVYQVVLTGNKDNAYTLLMAYQKQDPDFANTYFQLGIIAKEWAKSFNPYREFEYTKKFIYDTKLYFNLAKLYMKDEKNKNRSYYENAPIIPKGKKLQIEDINAYIDSQVEDIEDYERNIIKIITFYNKSSDSYNACVSTFMNINGKYSKIKNIYLSDETELVSNMKKLTADFDSALANFRLYKEALSKFPLKGHNQIYRLKDIITYRLDGLTYSDFMQNDIVLWNYKKWVNDVDRMKGTVIKNNLADIKEQDAELKAEINTVSNGLYSDQYKPYKTDEKFIYKIEKFDNNSLLIKLFKLNETKLNYLNYFKKEINNPTDITKYSILKRAEYCNDFVKEKQAADSINKVFLTSIKPEEIKKYKNFYVPVYGGTEGLKKYALRQELFFDAKLNDALLNLKKQLYYSVYEINTDTLIYDGQIISKKIVDASEKLPGRNTYRITNFNYTKDKRLWFAGYYISDNDSITGFTAYSKDNKHVDFIKTAGENMTYNPVSSAFNDGCWIVQTTLGEPIKNILIKYNNQGEEEFSQELAYSSIPRLMKYDDINNNLIIVFNGKSLAKTPEDKEQIIYHFNPDDQLQTYEVKTEAEATVFDLIRVNKDLLVFSNFVSYKDLNGNTINSKAGTGNNSTNILLTVISKGMVKKYIPFFNTKPFFGVKSLKINSNTIDILGYKSEPVTTDFNSLNIKEFYYEVIDAQGKEIHSAWHD